MSFSVKVSRKFLLLDGHGDGDNENAPMMNDDDDGDDDNNDNDGDDDDHDDDDDAAICKCQGHHITPSPQSYQRLVAKNDLTFGHCD